MTLEDAPSILIVGGYGVFGGRLARLLIEQGNVRALVAGRSLDKARRFCAEFGGEPLRLDRDADLTTELTRLWPDVVVDAAGPFQAYGDDPYRLARASIECGAHYLDLSDDAEFASGIRALDEQARQRNCVLLSGVSSVPAISAAAVRHLATDLNPIEAIETVILPGNRAPRGLSVIQAILAQAGQPMRLWRGRRWTQTRAWGAIRRVRLRTQTQALDSRWASDIGCPDLELFPAHFRARSVRFRAGLELSLLHLGLSALSFLPRVGLIKSLAPWAPALKWIADRLHRFGSDRGGMRVTVLGRDANGLLMKREWTLIAEAGKGPFVPALPGAILVQVLLNGNLRPGARPCLEELSVSEVEQAGRRIQIHCDQSESEYPPLYERVLGHQWSRLPSVVRDAHELVDHREFSGESTITTGKHPLSYLVRWIMGFPPAGQGVPVQVTMERIGDREHWHRRFGKHQFKSVLSREQNDPPGQLRERFGLMQFGLSLPSDITGLQMPVLRGWFLGLPLPRWMLPVSQTREFVDNQGRFCFDVDISLPLIGRIVRYQGWLRPLRDRI